MFRKVLFVLGVLILCCASIGGKASAQSPQPVGPTTHSESGKTSNSSNSYFIPNKTQSQSQTPSSLTLGQSGESFRYVQTFGETEVPYLADTTHLNRPEGLFIDPSNNLFVGESQGVRVLKYSPTGTNLLDIGHAGAGYRADYNFDNPQDMVLDSGGNIWVADGNRIVQYDAAGVFQQQFPVDDPWQSGSDNGHFDWVHGIALDHANHLFVSDGNNNRGQEFDMTSGSPVYADTITGFNQPYRMAVNSTNSLYIADQGNNRVQQCDYVVSSWVCSTVTSLLNRPQGLTIDASDNLYIADTEDGQIVKCPSGGACSVINPNTYWPYDLAIDSDGNIFGSTSYNSLVMKYDSSGAFVSNYLGVENVPYLTDGAHFNHPRVAIDKDDNIIVLEENGQRLTKLNSNGVALWSIGAPGFDQQGVNDHFNWPHGVAVDKNGFIYVADNNRVQIYNGDGFIRPPSEVHGVMGIMNSNGQPGSPLTGIMEPSTCQIAPTTAFRFTTAVTST